MKERRGVDGIRSRYETAELTREFTLSRDLGATRRRSSFTGLIKNDSDDAHGLRI
jgi:hypothetical protein